MPLHSASDSSMPAMPDVRPNKDDIFDPDTVAQSLPSHDSLVERFSLTELGRENGRHDQPVHSEPNHDLVERAVEQYCHSLHHALSLQYRRKRDDILPSLTPERPTGDPDAMLRNAKNKMQSAFISTEPEIERRRTAVIDARGRPEDDVADAEPLHRPQLRFWGGIGVIVLLLIVETLLNGTLFAENIISGVFGGIGYAISISFINVVGLGLAASHLWPTAKVSFRRSIGRWLGITTIVAAAVLLNLAVAHYREALGPGFPPAPQSDAAGDPNAACWRGNDAAGAEREALCLLRTNWFVLEGFLAYVLMILGLMAFAFAVWDWRKLPRIEQVFAARKSASVDDNSQNARDKSEALLDATCNDLSRELDDIHRHFVNRQWEHVGKFDPVIQIDNPEKAFAKLRVEYNDFLKDARYLEKTCRSAIETYRSAVRIYRKTNEDPPSWRVEWTPKWTAPDPPAEPTLAHRPDAEALSGENKLAATKRIADLDKYRRDLWEKVRRLKKIVVA